MATAGGGTGHRSANMRIEARADEPAVTAMIPARIAPTGWAVAWRPLAHILASAGLLVLVVPSPGLGVAAWIALVPLVVAVRRESPGRAALLGVAFGAASLAIMHPWFLTLPGVNVFNTAALFGYLALYPAIWCAALAFLIRRKLPWVFSGAVLWVLLDWLRGRAGFLALPFDPLSYSQIMDLPLLQLAAFGGAPAIAFVVCATNLALALALEVRSMRPLAVPLPLLAPLPRPGHIPLHFSPPPTAPAFP